MPCGRLNMVFIVKASPPQALNKCEAKESLTFPAMPVGRLKTEFIVKLAPPQP